MALNDDIRWFEQFAGTPAHDQLRERPVAYFCAEFALRDDLPTYAGGLGVLAGDIIKEAADRGLPMVGVGLYYREGYTCSYREHEGEFMEVCTETPPEKAGLQPVDGSDGKPVIVSVPVQDRSVSVRAWRADVGTAEHGSQVSIYFLDTNLPENSESDRHITNRLYVGDKQVRLQQELVLGIGGLRLLEKLGIHPSIYHLNEGHSAFLALELIRHEMEERSVGFATAQQFARRRIVFTNHTLLPAGNETYDNDLVALMLGSYCQKLGAPVQDVLALGLVHESSTFSMTMLSLRIASIINGVSKLHATKAREVWASHPMVGITNGVHLPTWDALSAIPLEERGAFWKAHQEKKRALLEFVREKTGRQWPDDALLLGWARRITGYKRPLAILEDAQRFADIARAADRPVRLLISGQPHPGDKDGNAMLMRLREATEGELADVAAYIPEYSLQEGQLMTAGCDVWLNTPVVGYEASGTSGMKAALNGVLPCSTRDGWVAEAELFGVGWIVDSGRITEDLLGVLERDIVPQYYARETDGIPADWERHMRNARVMTRDQFSATRALREYAELLYS
jgi:starch phosphorylase